MIAHWTVVSQETGWYCHLAWELVAGTPEATECMQKPRTSLEIVRVFAIAALGKEHQQSVLTPISGSHSPPANEKKLRGADRSETPKSTR